MKLQSLDKELLEANVDSEKMSDEELAEIVGGSRYSWFDEENHIGEIIQEASNALEG